MKFVLLFCGVAFLFLSGCSTLGVDADTEARAAYHMMVADSLKQRQEFAQAALEYQIVSEHYPSSSAYPDAVRNAALVYLNPDNPVRNDSLALHWLSAYLALPALGSDRENAKAQIHLLERVSTLQQHLTERRQTTDSLLAVNRKQDAQISSQAQQLQTLQNELKQIRQELTRLKQVDVQINRSRRK